MCGIAGWIDFTQNLTERKPVIDKMSRDIDSPWNRMQMVFILKKMYVSFIEDSLL